MNASFKNNSTKKLNSLFLQYFCNKAPFTKATGKIFLISVLHYFKHDRQNKSSNRQSNPAEFQEFQATLDGNKMHHRRQMSPATAWKGEHCLIHHTLMTKIAFLFFV